ncbi:radical SAM protein [Tropicimonas sp. S265A]|uniref:radical SAM protein n=1 Tax=Tropicimonas sp. S265A TaxID=3415134 RepID=UPI003C7A5BD1
MSLEGQPPHDATEVDAAPSHWVAAWKTIKTASGRWKSGRRVTVSSPDYIDPRPFCDDLLARALADRRFLNAAHRAEFFDWAATHGTRVALMPLVAGHDLLSRGDRARALDHLSTAMALDQDDLYAQELWFEARGEPIKPIDATKHFCTNPFERIESASRNRVMFCCPAWLPVPVGSLGDDTAEEVWNSQAAQDIRASIHDGSYRYCSRMHCPWLSEKKLPKVSEIRNPQTRTAMLEKSTVIPRKIKRVGLAHDRSCNLSCPSCRTKLIIADREETARLDALTKKALLPLLLSSRRVTITGSGDPFSSKHYRSVIRELTRHEDAPIIDLQTNGLLLARSWEPLGLEGHVGKVLLSIDASRKETYEVVRRGGIFEDLLENLEYLSKLRKRGAVEDVRIDFVTQALNFREMPEAADLMRQYGFDGIKFQMLRSWNTWSSAEFRRQHVGHPDHPEHAEFRRIMKDPRLWGADVQYSGFYSLTSG